jgi:hypothetical protein
MLEIGLASIVAKIGSQGDTSRLEHLLARAIGPVKHEVELSGELETNANPEQLIQIAVQMAVQSRESNAIGDGSKATD